MYIQHTLEEVQIDEDNGFLSMCVQDVKVQVVGDSDRDYS